MKISNEQLAKLATCKDAEEVAAVAKAEGIDLTQEQAQSFFASTQLETIDAEQLKAVSGGCSSDNDNAIHCMSCGSTNVTHTWESDYHCNDCGYDFAHVTI